MLCTPDDVSQLPDNRDGYIPNARDRSEQPTILLHKRLDTVIDQEGQLIIPQQKRERLKSLHQQIREDLATIRYGANERTLNCVERQYSTNRNYPCE